jgi:NAD-dependent dihydropyrimidine dehydrogenase PreA subunit
MGYHHGVGKTGFRAVIDRELCSCCGVCFRACNVKAIGLPHVVQIGEMSGRNALVADDLCLGCGACVSACRVGALSMVPAANRKLPPLKRKDLFFRILKEKRRLTPFVVSGVRKSLRNLLQGKSGKSIVPIIQE